MIIELDCVDSTSDEVKRRLEGGQKPPFWVVAKQQTNGRGSRGRSWSSLDGNLFASGAYEINRPLADAATLSFVTSLSVAQTVNNWVDENRIKLKWPNDVLIDDSKISGILLESNIKNQIVTMIIGVGINVKSAPEIENYRTTSILNSLKTEKILPNTLEVLEKFLENFDANFRLWQEKGFLGIKKQWISMAWSLGGVIRLKYGNQNLEGKFIDISDSGELILSLKNCKNIVVNAGEILFN